MSKFFGLKSKRGFSLVEVMVAMVVITIVTISAVSIILSSLRATQKNVDINRADYFSYDAFEAFKSADDEENFKEIMKFAGYELPEKDADGKYVLIFNGYSAEIKAEYAAAGAGTDQSTLTIAVKDGKGNEIANYSFHKGGTE